MKSINNYWNRAYDRGSITLEATIVMAFFLCIALSLTFFIKIAYTHEIIQHALNQTANDLAQLCYIYHLSGADDLAKQIENEFSKDNMEELDRLLAEYVPEELHDEVYPLIETAKGIYNGDFDMLCASLIKEYMKKYLTGPGMKDPEEKLRALNILGGINGLDMSMSGILANERKDIDLVVKYKMDIPVPVRLFPPLCFEQRATVRAWLYGDEDKERKDNTEEIWNLGNFERGRKIREIFGANLPFNFPVIARFVLDSGTASMIKSMDLTAKTYQEPEAVVMKIQSYIDELAAYEGQDEPWGRDGIVIRKEDIKRRELILVIPGNPIDDNITKALEMCKTYAGSKNVILRIEKYGYKNIT